MNNKKRNRKSNRGLRDGVIGRLFAQTKLPAHVTEEQDWYLDTPDVRLTRVFTIVLILHVVAVGGILAFKMIEKATTPGSVTATVATPAATAEARGETSARTAPATVTQNEVSAAAATPAAVSPPVLVENGTPGVIEYRVTGGQSLVDVSRKMGVSVAAIKAENDISNGLNEGMWIRVTKDGNAKPKAAAEVAATARPDAADATPEHRVSNPAPAAAETTAIAAPPAVERPATVAPAAARPNSYVVKKGDTFYGISRKFGIKYTDLMAANGIKSAQSLQPGQTLKIPSK